MLTLKQGIKDVFMFSYLPASFVFFALGHFIPQFLKEDYPANKLGQRSYAMYQCWVKDKSCYFIIMFI
jgi:hypothetical protein